MLAFGIILVPGTAGAAETGHFLKAPAATTPPPVRLAVQYDLKLRLPEGRGLARLLLDAGVDQGDAAAAARLAAGHLGNGSGGCEVKVSITRAGNGFRLVRAMLMTEADQTVIEWRGAELAIASETAARKSPRLV
jgi:hypothetical protein